MLFSQRKGLKPVKTMMQVDSMDTDLRNGLWNMLQLYYWRSIDDSFGINADVQTLLTRLWLHYFKQPLDSMPHNWYDVKQQLRDYFFRSQWNEVYDFVEFVAKNHPNAYINGQFQTACNAILEREVSAYRFVNDNITQITSAQEIKAIEDALAERKSPVTVYLSQALNLLSDRQNPDYRNSIKESISAVESMSQVVTGAPRATLGQAIKKIEDKTGIPLPQALQEAFSKLYGWTSDSQGIRHALIRTVT